MFRGLRTTLLLLAPLAGFPSLAFAAPLSFTVNLSEPVTVNTGGGTSRIALDIGGVTRYASYASGV